MIWAALLMTTVASHVAYPAAEDDAGQPTLFGLYDQAIWTAYPGCLSYRSNREQGRYRRYSERLRALQPVLASRYGAEMMDLYHTSQADEAHGIHFLRCPEVDRRFNHQLLRAIERVERAASQVSETG